MSKLGSSTSDTKRSWGRAALWLAACFAAGCAANSPIDPDVVETTLGPVRGVAEGMTRAFRGIPYAAPPVGPLRFRAPAPIAAWEAPRQATALGAACMQTGDDGKLRGDEDCLTLNIVAPLDARDAPVLVWFHGGDNLIGSAIDYDPRPIVEETGAIVVTVNYRLGAFGWLAHPSLADEEGSTGNWGLRDQLAALRFVKDNATAFGGGPGRIAVAGQSAGASDLCAILASEPGRGLFDRAILQSLNCHVLDPSTVSTTNAALADALACTNAADPAVCLREAPAPELERVAAATLAAGANADFYVTVDGVLVKEAPEASLRAGRHADVPIIVGTTSEEYLNLLPLFVDKLPTTEAELDDDVRRIFGEEVAAQRPVRYPLSRYGGSAVVALSAMLSDVVMHCPTRRAARALAQTGSQPVFRYVYAHAFEDPAVSANGVAHGFDVMALFRTSFGAFELSARDRAVGKELGALWAGFAANGAPSADPAWPRYSIETEPFLIVEESLAVSAKFRDAECDYWDAS